MKYAKKLLIYSITGAVLFSTVGTTFPDKAKAASGITIVPVRPDVPPVIVEEDLTNLTLELLTKGEYLNDLLTFDQELSSTNTTYLDIANPILTEMNPLIAPIKEQVYLENPILQNTNMQLISGLNGAPDIQEGAKITAAKTAVKAAIKTLQRIGQVSWDRSMRVTINKLPVPNTWKTNLKRFLAYKVVMDVLEVAVDFSGTVTGMIEKGLKKVGIPSYLAGVGARAIVFILL